MNFALDLLFYRVIYGECRRVELTMDPKKRCGTKRNLAGLNHPKVIGLPRNEFGTRRCQRVQCEKCAKVDYVPILVGLAKQKFCRDCAEKLFFAYDQGRHIAEKQVFRVCGQCRRDFSINESLAKKKDQLLCPDCHRGFDVWRGSAAAGRNLEGQPRPQLLRIGSRTTFRKNVDDKL